MKVKNIAVDLGNTRIKSGEFDGEKLLAVKTWDSLTDLAAYCDTLEDVKIGICSVRKHEDIQSFFHSRVKVISLRDPLPVSIDYKTPETLGTDRVMGVIGARMIVERGALLVIDMGTCVTYDLLSDENVYLGGVIAPGLRMRMTAMHQQTGNLPDIYSVWKDHLSGLVGKSTAECMVKGTVDALQLEIGGFIQSFKKEFPLLSVILTGGDSVSFESRLKEPIFADQNLVLKGINSTLINF